MKSVSWVAVIALSCILPACDSDGTSSNETAIVNSVENSSENTGEITDLNTSNRAASITDLTVSGEPLAYSFNVTVSSPDLGCSQYADWWEVIYPDGQLIFRRVLAHSHVNEQPFARSGGPVQINADQNVIVRVHMNNTGYSEQVYSGSVAQGFVTSTLETSFAQTLEFSEPLPDGCAF